MQTTAINLNDFSHRDWFSVSMRHLWNLRLLLNPRFYRWIKELDEYDQDRTGGTFGPYLSDPAMIPELYENWFAEGYEPSDFLEEEIAAVF